MNFADRDEAFWETFTFHLMQEVYKTDNPKSDYLNVGGWISDIEAGDASVDEMIAAISNAVYDIHGEVGKISTLAANSVWLAAAIEAAYYYAQSE